jgi:hypothetical protein
MDAVAAALITGLLGLVATWLTVRRPMKKEHNANVELNARNAQTLGRIEGTVDSVKSQVEDTDRKLDRHIEDHARGIFHQ